MIFVKQPIWGCFKIRSPKIHDLYSFHSNVWFRMYFGLRVKSSDDAYQMIRQFSLTSIPIVGQSAWVARSKSLKGHIVADESITF